MKIVLDKWNIILLLGKHNFVHFILKHWKTSMLKNQFTKFISLANNLTSFFIKKMYPSQHWGKHRDSKLEAAVQNL